MVIGQKVYAENIGELFQRFDAHILLLDFLTLILDIVIIAESGKSGNIGDCQTFFNSCFRKVGKS